MTAPDNLLEFAAAALAAWRLAAFLVLERGPWEMATRLRSLVGVEHDEDGDPTNWPTRMPGALFGCVWCMTAWTAGAMYGILLVRPEIVIGLGIWGLATAIDGAVRGGRA
jgi:hypothetical protein